MYFQRSKISKFFPIALLVFLLLFILITPSLAQTLDEGIMGNAAIAAEIGEANLPTILGKIFKAILSILGLVALIIVIIAGAQWMTSGGISEKIKKAKALLSAGLIGLLIIICAYALVSFIISGLTGVTTGGGCTPGLCCSDELRCDANSECKIPDTTCSTTLPQENFRLIRGEANFDANDEVYLCSNIRAVFNHVINQDTFNVALANSTLKVLDADNNPVAGSFTTTGKSILFIPTNFWTAFSDYKLIIPDTISDTNGRSLVGCSAGFTPTGHCSSNGTIDWDFTTNNKDDETPPYVDHAYPIMDNDPLYPDRNVSRAPMIDVIFNENIDYATIIDMNHVDYVAGNPNTWHPIVDNFQLGQITGWTCRQYDESDSVICEEQNNLEGNACFWMESEQKCVANADLGVEMATNGDGSETNCNTLCNARGLSHCYLNNKCIANKLLEEYVIVTYNNNNLIIAPISQGFRIFVAGVQWLDAFTWYEIQVDRVYDMCNNQMLEAQSWVFETNNNVPGVQDWWPLGENVCPDALIGIRFATSMYEYEVSVEVKNNDTGDVEFAGSIKPSDFDEAPYKATLDTLNGFIKVMDDDNQNTEFKVFQLELSNTLSIDTSYTVKISTDLVKDIGGNFLGKEWDFDVTNMEVCACAPVIYQISPPEGPRKSCVTITGHCFAGTSERPATIDELWFDDTPVPPQIPPPSEQDGPIVATAQGSTATSITTIIPDAYGDPIGDINDFLGVGIKIIYEDNQEEVESFSQDQFTVIDNALAEGPCIWRLRPNKGYVGDRFNIEGIKFGYATSTNAVVNMEDSTVVSLPYNGSWTPELITGVMVTGFDTAGNRNVTVTDNNSFTSNPVPFDVIFDRPEVKEFGCNPPPEYSSPSPYKDTEDACTAIDLVVEFTENMWMNGTPNGVLNSENYTIESCGTGDEFNLGYCPGNDILISDVTQYDTTSDKVIKISLDTPPLDTNTWYQVLIASNIESQEMVAMGDDYTWHFKTQDNPVCEVANLSLDPDNAAIVGCDVSQEFTATPTANNCNVLICGNYAYNWLSSDIGIATISATCPAGSCSNTAYAEGAGSTWIRVEESDSSKWTKELLNVNCCNTDEDCYDPDDDGSNRCDGSICDDDYGICTPIIKRFNPVSGSYNDWVTIQGCWFNNYNASYSKVRFNEELSSIPFDRCTSSAWQNEQIIAEVPETGNPFGAIEITSAPYGSAFVDLSGSNFTTGVSYVGICNLIPNHGIPGSVTQLTANDNLEERDIHNDYVYYIDVAAIDYPAPGWVAQTGIRSQAPFILPLGIIDVKVFQNSNSNTLNFNVDPIGGGPEDECILQCPTNCNVGVSYCSSPYNCLEKSSIDCRCCCDTSELNACNNVDLECLVGQGDCTGTERGLCCGCENDAQCTGAGCGFLDPNRCCYNRPTAGIETCTASIGAGVGLNTTFKLTFTKLMDRSRLNNEYVKVSKAGVCRDDDGQYIGDRCYLNGQVVSTNSTTNNTTIFYPNNCKLTISTEYKIEFIVEDDGEGVRSSHGVSYSSMGSGACTWDSTLNCQVFAKTTATQQSGGFCDVDKVNVEPRDFTIKGINNPHDFLGLALDADNNSICVESFVWTSSMTNIATVDPASALSTTATSKNYGETLIKAIAENKSCDDTEPNTCGNLKVIPTTLPQVVEQQGCEVCSAGGQSPSPWKDSQENCPNAQIVVRFNREMEEDTLIPTNIALTKDGSPVTIEDDDIETSYVNGETILYIKDTLALNTDYKMTLISGLEGVTGGIKDTNDLPLDGNGNDIQDGAGDDDYINDNYVWEFKTVDEVCTLNKICIVPQEEVQLNPPHPNTQEYYTDTYASNCNYLLASSFNDSYEWTLENQEPAQPGRSIAKFLPSASPLIDDWEATIQSLNLGEAEVEVSMDNSIPLCPEINDSVHLIVATYPAVDEVFPTDLSGDVCRNIVITAKFNQIMDDSTISSDTVQIFGQYSVAQIGLECTGCGGTVTFENLYYKLKNLFTKNVSAQANNCWCELPANISTYEEDNKTIVKIDKGLLDIDEREYKVIIQSGINGVKTQYGLEMLGTNYEWSFTAGILCELSRVEITPEDIYFNTAGDLENLEARAYDSQGTEIFGVPGYNWDWLWGSSNSAVVDISGELTNPQTDITSKNQDGLSQITATATLNIGVPPIGGSSVIGQVQAQVSICQHPWVYLDADTNFKFFYCRDNNPLLPRLLLKGEGVIPSNCGNGIINAGEICDVYEGTPSHATCLFDCSDWVCDDGYYEVAGECITKWPSAPSGLLAEKDEINPDAQINLNWNDNSVNEDGFEIEHKIFGGVWGWIATVAPNIIFYNDTGLTQATAYYYKIKAFNVGEDGNTYYSPYCSEASETTGCPEGECYEDGNCYEEEECITNTTQMCFEGQWINSCGNGILDNLGDCSEICDGVLGYIPGYNTHCRDDCLNWECDAGWGACEGTNSCQENLLENRLHCGECDNDCSQSQTCENGICVYLSGPPATPSGLTATQNTMYPATRIDLVWDDTVNEDGFRIERKALHDPVWVQIPDLGANITSYNDVGLNSNTTYLYKIKAYNDYGESAWSTDVLGATAIMPSYVPEAPSGLSGTPYITQIELNWTDNSPAPGGDLRTQEDGFDVEIKIGANWTFLVALEADVTSYTHTGLNPDTFYIYRIRVYNGYGESYSVSPNFVMVTTNQGPPSDPFNLIANFNSADPDIAIDLAWEHNSTNEDGFYLERKEYGEDWTTATTITISAPAYTRTDTGLIGDETYVYRIMAYSTNYGSSGYSNEVEHTTSNCDILECLYDGVCYVDGVCHPYNLQYCSGPNWENSCGNSTYTCNDEICDGVNTPFHTICNNDCLGWTCQTNCGDCNGISSDGCEIVDLLTNHDHCGACNNPCGTDEVCQNGICETTTVAAPSDMVATQSSMYPATQIHLQWVDHSSNEDGFRIERYIGPNLDFVTTVNTNVVGVVNNGLTRDTIYSYRVQAYEGSNNSNWSDEVFCSTSDQIPITNCFTVVPGIEGSLRLIGNDPDYPMDGDYYLEPLQYQTSISCSGTFNPIGTDPDYGVLIEPFTGVFNGNGHSIIDLTMNLVGWEVSGLFGALDGAEVLNLDLFGLDILSPGAPTGGLAGKIMNTVSISNCTVSGDIDGHDDVGGLIGFVEDDSYVEIFQCSSIVDIEGYSEVGGLIGRIGSVSYSNTYVNINQSYSASYPNEKIEGMTNNLGGLIGYIGSTNGVEINDSYSVANIEGGNTYTDVGGLVGGVYFDVDIQNCYSAAVLSGSINIGALIGEDGSTAGSFIGESYWDTSKSGPISGSGYWGYETAGARTTAEMISLFDIGTYVGWDFNYIWKEEPGAYPCLQWQRGSCPLPLP